MQYIPGKRNVIADVLSRVSPLPFKSTDIKTVNCIASNELSVNVPATPTRLQEYQNSTQNDPTLQLLTQYTHQGWPESCKDCPHELLGYWTYRECISLENGLLFKDNRLIIPQSECEDTLELLHYGHYGVNHTTDRARETVFWSGINDDIQRKVSQCQVCQENSPSLQ